MSLPFLFGSRKKKFDAESLGVRFVPVQTFFFSATKNSKLELDPTDANSSDQALLIPARTLSAVGQ